MWKLRFTYILLLMALIVGGLEALYVLIIDVPRGDLIMIMYFIGLCVVWVVVFVMWVNVGDKIEKLKINENK